jgi:hypothetical protein
LLELEGVLLQTRRSLRVLLLGSRLLTLDLLLLLLLTGLGATLEHFQKGSVFTGHGILGGSSTRRLMVIEKGREGERREEGWDERRTMGGRRIAVVDLIALAIPAIQSGTLGH